MDLDALSVQVKERRAIESEEKYRNEAFGEKKSFYERTRANRFALASDMTRNDQIVQLLDARKETDMKKLNHVRFSSPFPPSNSRFSQGVERFSQNESGIRNATRIRLERSGIEEKRQTSASK